LKGDPLDETWYGAVTELGKGHAKVLYEYACDQAVGGGLEGEGGVGRVVGVGRLGGGAVGVGGWGCVCVWVSVWVRVWVLGLGSGCGCVCVSVCLCEGAYCTVLYVCVPNLQYVPNPDQNINPVYCHNPGTCAAAIVAIVSVADAIVVVGAVGGGGSW
jgi:hypothetical protein